MKKEQPAKTELEKRLEAQAEKEHGVSNKPQKQPEGKPQDAETVQADGEVDVAALTAERDALQDQALRARAEFENYRKRVARDHERMRRTAAEGLMTDLLPVVDNLERALDHADDASGGLAQGVEMVLEQFLDVLGRHGLEPIPAHGEPFDPNVHEAIMQVEVADAAADHVAQEFQRGYRLGDYVVRPSKVAVSSGATEPGESETSE